METKELIEGAILSALVTVVIIIGFFLPLLGNFLLILSPLPIIVAVIRWNSRLGILASLLSGLILFVLINPGLFLFTIFYTGLLGVSLGAAFAEKFKPKVVLAIGTIATVCSFLLTFVVVNYILDIDILAQIKQQIDIVTQTYQQLGVSKTTVNQVSEQLLNMLQITFPTLLLCSGFIIAGFNYYASVRVLNKLNFGYDDQLEIEKFRLSKIVILVYLITILFNFNPIIKNLYILTTFLLTLEGLAVIYHYYLNKNIPTTFVVVGLVIFPLLINLSFLLGVFDLWFDFRNLDNG